MKQGIRPLVTEKTFKMASKGWYVFAVSKAQDKPDVASELHKAYGVDVIEMKTVAMHGKMRRAGKKQNRVQQQNWKKIFVKLKAGQKFDFFESTGGNAPAEGTK